MARATKKLTDSQIRKAGLKPGIYGDGAGLYLRVSSAGNKAWVFIYTKDGRRREAGMGSYPECPLVTARELAEKAHGLLAKGQDPIAEKRKSAPPALKVACEDYIKQLEASGKGGARRCSFLRGVAKRHLGKLGDQPMNHISSGDIADRLRAVQAVAPSAAKELRGLIERAFSFGKPKGWWSGENPAAWRDNLKPQLLSLGKKAKHHPAMPLADVPAFFAKLRGKDAMTARALAFIILTAARRDEARFAEWKEIDMKAGIWTIPAERTKQGRDHRVPLSAPALAILRELGTADGAEGYLFPGREPGRPVGHSSLQGIMPKTATTHGFRSCLKDWAMEETQHPYIVSELALGHWVSDDTQKAYARSDLLKRRAALMAEWGAFVAGEAPKAAA